MFGACVDELKSLLSQRKHSLMSIMGNSAILLDGVCIIDVGINAEILMKKSTTESDWKPKTFVYSLYDQPGHKPSYYSI